MYKSYHLIVWLIMGDDVLLKYLIAFYLILGRYFLYIMLFNVKSLFAINERNYNFLIKSVSYYKMDQENSHLQLHFI